MLAGISRDVRRKDHSRVAGRCQALPGEVRDIRRGVGEEGHAPMQRCVGSANTWNVSVHVCMCAPVHARIVNKKTSTCSMCSHARLLLHMHTKAAEQMAAAFHRYRLRNAAAGTPAPFLSRCEHT